jgi:predicted TIM-barrel fold metal-dependent hydrolase
MSGTDKFIAMVSAKVDVDLRLSDFQPRPMLVAPVHQVLTAKFAAIDFHNHLDAQDPADVLRIMDECGIERTVNITMKVGEEALTIMRRFHTFAPKRFSTIAWMDWSGLEDPGFFERTVERFQRCVEAGACGLKIWKDLGLQLRDANGELLRIDDVRLRPLFEEAAKLGVPVMFHIADPDAFFLPIDRFNERYEELAAHPDWGFHGSHYSKDELLMQRDRVFARHPHTTFVAAHMAEKPENLVYLDNLLASCPNVFVDMSARTAELGRQPYTSRDFFLKHADRILFGTDLVPAIEMYRLHFRFLETSDEYFEYPSHASRQGRWNIYGLHLPDDVLRKVYRENALRLFNLKSTILP